MRLDLARLGNITGAKIERHAIIAGPGNFLADGIIGQDGAGLVMRHHRPERGVEFQRTHARLPSGGDAGAGRSGLQLDRLAGWRGDDPYLIFRPLTLILAGKTAKRLDLEFNPAHAVNVTAPAFQQMIEFAQLPERH